MSTETFPEIALGEGPGKNSREEPGRVGTRRPIPEVTTERLHAGAPWLRRSSSRERCRPEGQVGRDRRQQRERPDQASSHGVLPSRSGKAR
jgi:hypothetical protein